MLIYIYLHVWVLRYGPWRFYFSFRRLDNECRVKPLSFLHEYSQYNLPNPADELVLAGLKHTLITLMSMMIHTCLYVNLSHMNTLCTTHPNRFCSQPWLRIYGWTFQYRMHRYNPVTLITLGPEMSSLLLDDMQEGFRQGYKAVSKDVHALFTDWTKTLIDTPSDVPLYLWSGALDNLLPPVLQQGTFQDIVPQIRVESFPYHGHYFISNPNVMTRLAQSIQSHHPQDKHKGANTSSRGSKGKSTTKSSQTNGSGSGRKNHTKRDRVF